MFMIKLDEENNKNYGVKVSKSIKSTLSSVHEIKRINLEIISKHKT